MKITKIKAITEAPRQEFVYDLCCTPPHHTYLSNGFVSHNCVCLLDEVDKAGFSTSSQSGDSGVGKRIMGAILTFMQENTAPVFWVMTANRVNGMPPELFRKGRLDEIFAVTSPNKVERMEVLKIHIRKRGHDPEAVEDLVSAVVASKGYVSAELEASIKDGLIIAFLSKQKLHGKHIVQALQSSKPLSEAFAEDFAEMEDWAIKHARAASSPDNTLLDEEPVKRTARRRRLSTPS